jgi:hypothetical protein
MPTQSCSSGVGAADHDHQARFGRQAVHHDNNRLGVTHCIIAASLLPVCMIHEAI